MTTLCNSCESQDTCKIFEIMSDSMPITHCKNYIQTRRETVRCKQTNADRIRSMTDEELAKTLNCIPNSGGCIMGNYYDMDCERCILDWLKKEVDDG